MNPQNTQQNMTPDESAAALSFANNISNKLFLGKQPTGNVSQETQQQPVQNNEQGNDVDTKIEQMRKELESSMQKGFANLRDDIKQALQEEDDKENE